MTITLAAISGSTILGALAYAARLLTRPADSGRETRGEDNG